jgi:hypothetical protein
MTNITEFFDLFNSKKLDKALHCFETLTNEDKQKTFDRLFQASRCTESPMSVSVLFRRLHEGKSFDDFYNAWSPPKSKCSPLETGGYLYQQFYGGPIRVINAINIADPLEIVSIGLHWISDNELQSALNNPKVIHDGNERGDQIGKVAEKQKTGIFKVIKDDNLGTSF